MISSRVVLAAIYDLRERPDLKEGAVVHDCFRRIPVSRRGGDRLLRPDPTFFRLVQNRFVSRVLPGTCVADNDHPNPSPLEMSRR
jgi:hypothetical protein